MYDSIIKKAAELTNIRGRYRFSAALLDIELDRIAASRDFSFKYGKSEWVGDPNKPQRTVQLDDGDYKQLVVCLSDGTSVDVTSMLASDSMSCDSSEGTDKLAVKKTCGMIEITAAEGFFITSIKAKYKKSDAEIREYLVDKFGSVFVSYLRWQLLSDIDAKSAGVAYNVYIQSLIAIEKEDTE